jgi:hypothetical protein
VATLDSPVLQVGTQGTLTGTTFLQATGAGVIAVALEAHRNLQDATDQKLTARTVPGRGTRVTPDVIVADLAGTVSTATPTPTGEEPIATFTPTTTAMPTDTPTPTPIACVGDCYSQGSVTVDDVITTVRIALGDADVSECRAGDADQDGQITIDEILTAVNNALNGCGS